MTKIKVAGFFSQDYMERGQPQVGFRFFNLKIFCEKFVPQICQEKI